MHLCVVTNCQCYKHALPLCTDAYNGLQKIFISIFKYKHNLNFISVQVVTLQGVYTYARYGKVCQSSVNFTPTLCGT